MGQGICKVEDISVLKFSPKAPRRQYYTLRPLFQRSILIYVPVDEPSLTKRMRPILSPTEVDQIILSTKGKKLILRPDHRERTIIYHEILSSNDEQALLLLTDFLYKKSKRCHKGLTSSELSIFKAAEAIIVEEFSFALNIPGKDVGNYIKTKLGVA